MEKCWPIENGPSILDVSIKMVIFHSYVTVYQRFIAGKDISLDRELYGIVHSSQQFVENRHVLYVNHP